MKFRCKEYADLTIKSADMNASDDSSSKLESPSAINTSNLDGAFNEASKNQNISKTLDDSFKGEDKSEIEDSFNLLSSDVDHNSLSLSDSEIDGELMPVEEETIGRLRVIPFAK